MKKLLYISVHSVLEYDELSLFTELGYECFSLGAYADPRGHYLLPRPGIPGMAFNEDLFKESLTFPRTEIPQSFIDKFDAVIVMHAPEVIRQNWERMRHKKVVWRTIGQSTPWVEKLLLKCKNDGMLIVRYSPFEEKLPNYIGSTDIIRFYKDPTEYKDWTGHDKKVVNFTQTLKGRRDFCGYDFLMGAGPGFPFKVYGSGNEDLGEFNGGVLPYDLMKGQLRDSRVFLYGGTWPASYTLAFIEAWMTGTPIVAAGEDFWIHKDNRDVKIYEVEKLINSGVNGFVANTVDKAKEIVQRLLEDDDYARKISSAGREEAIRIFGKQAIKEQWAKFLNEKI